MRKAVGRRGWVPLSWSCGRLPRVWGAHMCGRGSGHPLLVGPCARMFGTAKKASAGGSDATSETHQGTLPLEAANLPDPRSFAQEKTFWQTHDDLKLKRLQSKERGEVHFVFLEGCGGAGKKDLMWRLNKMGHEVIFHPFLTFMLDSPHQYAPKASHDILQVRWSNKVISSLENIAALSKGGKAYKNNLVFVHRSPLSSYHYAQNKQDAELYLKLLQELKTVFSSSVILCKADPLRVQERIGERLMVTHEREKALRRELGESADLDRINRDMEQYEQYMTSTGSRERCIGALVHTTSSKQATAQILKSYGVEMNWVWDELKKSSGGAPPAH